MASYEFADGFELAADADRVFAAIAETEDWTRWWPGLNSRLLCDGPDGADAPAGRVQRFWMRAPLGYAIEVVGEFLAVDAPLTLRARMQGDLDGDGQIVVTAVGEDRARVDYRLSVRLTRPWMRLVEPVARPLFTWGHHRVVGDALGGLAAKLAVDGPHRQPWTRDNLAHVARMLGLGSLDTATVYDSIGRAAFATAAPDWLNVGLWRGSGDAAEAPDAPRQLVERLAERLPRGGVVLDVGNGLGIQDPVVARIARPRTLVALNLTASQLRAGRAHLAEADALPVAADAVRLPVRDASVDGVISVEAAFHFPSRPAFFAEVARVLRPGGVLTMSDVPVQRYPRTPSEVAAGLLNARFWAVRRSALASDKQIASQARAAGLVDVQTERVGTRTVDPFVREARRRLRTTSQGPWLQRLAARMMLRSWALLRRRGVIDYLLVTARTPHAKARVAAS